MSNEPSFVLGAVLLIAAFAPTLIALASKRPVQAFAVFALNAVTIFSFAFFGFVAIILWIACLVVAVWISNAARAERASRRRMSGPLAALAIAAVAIFAGTARAQVEPPPIARAYEPRQQKCWWVYDWVRDVHGRSVSRPRLVCQ